MCHPVLWCGFIQTLVKVPLCVFGVESLQRSPIAALGCQVLFLLHLSGACFGTYVIICCATIRSADSEALEGVPPCGVVCLCSGYRAYTPVCTAVKSTQCSQTDSESLRAESAAGMPSCRMYAAFQQNMVRSHATAKCSSALSSCGMMCPSVMWAVDGAHSPACRADQERTAQSIC
jgi:hypothetical protein